MGRNYRLALSFANLIYLRAWADLIPYRSEDLFHQKALPGFSLYFALVGDVLALSLLVFGLLCIAPKMPGWVRRGLPVAAILMLAFATTFLRSHLVHVLPASVLAILLAIAFIAVAVLVLRFNPVAVRVLKTIFLAATPCVAVTFIAPLFYLTGPSPLPPDPPLAQRLPGTPPVRVMWVVFDEWDQQITFGNPANMPPIPEISALANRSFVSTRTLSAEAGKPIVDMATAAAIPALLYGKRLRGAINDDASTKRLAFADSLDLTVFGAGDNIFARVHAQGWNAAVSGWYLPYCRVFAPLLADCYWDVRYNQASSASPTPVAAALDETRMLFETELFSPFGWSLVNVRHFQEYEALMTAARRYAADPSIGVAFIHLNVPHKPYFYNPELGRFGRSDHPNDLYLNEMKWVDRSVTEILTALKKSGLDSKTAIILSSDHPARFSNDGDPHVPFIVHLPGEEVPMTSNPEFSALQSANLVMAIAKGDVRSPREIENYLLRDH